MAENDIGIQTPYTEFNPFRGATSTQTNPDADNAPFTQVYGQRRSTPLSMDEYLSGSMYDFAGIDVSAAPGIDDDDDDDDDDAQAAPNILTPVSERTDDPSQVFRAISQTGQLGTGYQVANVDPSKYLDRLLSEETFTIKEDGFSKYAQQKFTEGGGVATAGLTPALGPVTVLGAGAAALVEKQNKKNAQAIMQTGGGDLFTLNGATVSRAPGEKIFTGNLGGFSQGQLYASREMDFGFIPGSMREMTAASIDPYAVQGKKDLMKRSGNRGVVEAGVVSGHIMDAYGTIHGVSDESGVMQVGAIAAQRMRENEFRQNMIAAGLGAELTKMEKDGSFTMNAVRAKQHTDGIMKAGQGFRFRAANVPAGEYANALNNRGTTYRNFLASTHGTGSTTRSTTTPSTIRSSVDPSQPDDLVQTVSEARAESAAAKAARKAAARAQVEAAARQAAAIREAIARDRDEDRDDTFADTMREGTDKSFSQQDRTDAYYDDSAGFDYSGFFDSPSPQPESRTTTESVRESAFSDRGRFGAYGGRINMAAGDTPQATFEPGFVKGPPENFTERETVADDQNGKVKPDTFIINAAAVEIAGSEDIRNMLMKAYEVAVQKGLDIGRVDRKLYEGTVDVALSKGEVVVPPELAKIIGYDRLRKINNRGKKEVASRQKKAGGGFLTRKKRADGGEVDLEYEDRIVTDEVRRKMRTLIKSLPDDVEVESVYLQPGYPAAQRYENELARLNETLPLTGQFFSDSKRPVPRTDKFKRIKNPKINVPQTPTLLNLAILAEEVAHQDALKHRELYDPKKHKVDRDTFRMEQDYLEELRAKDFALDVVGALFPKGEKTFRGTRATYEKQFAKYLTLSDDPELVETYLKKHPELRRFIKKEDYPERKIGSTTIPGGSMLTTTGENYYGPGQPQVRPDKSFLDAAMREDIIAMNEYHASLGYMLDQFKYLVTQIFIPDADKPEYMQGYTASKGK